MRLFDRIIHAVERRYLRSERKAIYRSHIDIVAAGRLIYINRRLIDLGDQPLSALPYIGEESVSMVRPIVEDDCGVPDGLVGEWRAPV